MLLLDPSNTSDQNRSISGGQDDLTEDMIVSARRKTRVNAVILLLVFALISFAPQPWALFAPLLLIIPLLYSALARMHRLPSPPRPPVAVRDSYPDPFSCEPRDPKDPRRYRPIG